MRRTLGRVSTEAQSKRSHVEVLVQGVDPAHAVDPVPEVDPRKGPRLSPEQWEDPGLCFYPCRGLRQSSGPGAWLYFWFQGKRWSCSSQYRQAW